MPPLAYSPFLVYGDGTPLNAIRPIKVSLRNLLIEVCFNSGYSSD